MAPKRIRFSCRCLPMGTLIQCTHVVANIRKFASFYVVYSYLPERVMNVLEWTARRGDHQSNGFLPFAEDGTSCPGCASSSPFVPGAGGGTGAASSSKGFEPRLARPDGGADVEAPPFAGPLKRASAAAREACEAYDSLGEASNGVQAGGAGACWRR